MGFLNRILNPFIKRTSNVSDDVAKLAKKRFGNKARPSTRTQVFTQEEMSIIGDQFGSEISAGRASKGIGKLAGLFAKPGKGYKAGVQQAMAVAEGPIRPGDAVAAGIRSAIPTAGPVTRLGTAGAGMSWNLGKMALQNPRTALGIGAVGLTAAAVASSGPGASGMNMQEMGRLAQMSGASSTGFDPGMGAGRRQGSRNMWMNSTFGLAQGLHKGRHR